jgi:O-succinylbenzoate synthase
MRLKKIILHHLRMPMKETFKTAVSVDVVRETIIVEAWEKSGEIGWWEIVADVAPWYSCETVGTAWHIVKDFIAPLLKGKEVGPTTFSGVVGGIRGHRMAKAGVEFALWDLEGKLEGKTLRELVGGVREKVEVGLSVGVIGDEELLLETVRKGLEAGYRRIKLKVKPGWEIRPVKRVREEFGSIPLQVDANGSFNFTDEHISILKKLDSYNLLMVEQPLHHEDLLQHSKLQKILRTPICLDESIRSLMDAETAHELGSCKVINIKPGRVGGLLETLKIHDYALKSGISVWIGGMLESGVGRAFAIAAATLPGVKYPNDISPSDRFWVKDIVEPPWSMRNDGTIEVPKKSGIGVEVLENVLKSYEVRSVGIELG